MRWNSPRPSPTRTISSLNTSSTRRLLATTRSLMTRLRSRRRNTTKISHTLDVNHYHCDISMMYNHYHCDHISMSYSSSSLPTHHSSKLSSEPIHCYVKYFKINSFHPGDFPKKHFSFNSKCQNSLLQCHSISISSPDCWT